MFDQRRGLFHHLQVGLFKQNFLARTLSARLLAGLLRPADHDALAKRIKPVDQNAAKAVAVGD